LNISSLLMIYLFLVILECTHFWEKGGLPFDFTILLFIAIYKLYFVMGCIRSNVLLQISISSSPNKNEIHSIPASLGRWDIYTLNLFLMYHC